ncbi:MAG: class II histone deacetylase [Thermoleophilaceae bacterium]
MAQTGFCWDARCLAHENGSMLLDERAREWLDVPHVESPERMIRTRQVLERSGVLALLQVVEAREATREELELVHTAGLIGRVREARDAPGVVWIGPEARAGPATWEPALVSVGGLLECVDAVVDGRVRNAYVCLRPPGHHSSADTAMGFCLFNSVAIAARHAQRRHGLGRVAILDWDVHHGNGTQDIFYADPSVLFVSLHQDGLYPADLGRLEEVGAGDGEGRVVNVPLPAGTGDDGYVHAFERIVAPALRAFEPDLILVSAGQDPAAADPLGRMSATTEVFRRLAEGVVGIADEACGGRLVVYQEGGYSVDHLPFCALAVVEALAGLEPVFAGDPLELDVPTELRAVEREAVAAAAAAYARWWPVGG